MNERGKRKQECIELKKQQETKNIQEQKLKAKIILNKMDAIVKKAIQRIKKAGSNNIQMKSEGQPV